MHTYHPTVWNDLAGNTITEMTEHGSKLRLVLSTGDVCFATHHEVVRNVQHRMDRNIRLMNLIHHERQELGWAECDQIENLHEHTALIGQYHNHEAHLMSITDIQQFEQSLLTALDDVTS